MLERQAAFWVLFAGLLIFIFGPDLAARAVAASTGLVNTEETVEPSPTATVAPTEDGTATATIEPSPSSTFTPESVATNTLTPTMTQTLTPAASVTSTPTSTPTATNTQTPTPLPSETPVTPQTNTPLPPPPTATFTPTSTATVAATATSTPTATATQTATATPDPPILDLNGSAPGTGFSADFVSGQPAVPITSNQLQITVPRGPRLVSAVVRIASLPDGAAEELDADVSGTPLTKSYSAGVLRLQGSAPVATYQQVLQSVTYRNTAGTPNTSDRQISFSVNDGVANSNTAVTIVNIRLLRITLTISPTEQTIAQGGTAVFTVQVVNSGNRELLSVRARSATAPACNRNWNSIAPGSSRKYSCTVSNVESDLVVRFNVNGEDSDNNPASTAGTVRVEVENPNIRIRKSPVQQTVRPGETAQFDILVQNPSSQVNLGDVTVSDPLVPDCSREGSLSLGNLPAGTEIRYQCAQANVSVPFTNEITVSGRNLFTGQVVTDSSIASVDLLDLALSLQADPLVLATPGGPVNFSLTLRNRGNVVWTVEDLSSVRFGNLLDPVNETVRENSCLTIPRGSILPGEQLSCAFVADIRGQPGTYNAPVKAIVQDLEETMLQRLSAVPVVITDDSILALTLFARTDSVAPPGRFVNESVRIVNRSEAESLSLTTLWHGRLQDLHGRGDCNLPQEIAPGDAYACSYMVYIGGEIGAEVLHEVEARGRNAAGQVLADRSSWHYRIYDPALLRDLLPVVSSDYSEPVEDNDGPCEAYAISPGDTYEFMIDDREDWYWVEVVRSGAMIVDLRDFISPDPQLIVYRGMRCDALEVPAVAFDGSNSADKTLRFGAQPGFYYVRIVNSSDETFPDPYSLLVTTP